MYAVFFVRAVRILTAVSSVARVYYAELGLRISLI